MKITDSSNERVLGARNRDPLRGKSRSFGTTEGSKLGLDQPEAMKARWALQSIKRGHIYAFRKQYKNMVRYLVGYKFPMFSVGWTG